MTGARREAGLPLPSQWALSPVSLRLFSALTVYRVLNGGMLEDLRTQSFQIVLAKTPLGPP